MAPRVTALFDLAETSAEAVPVLVDFLRHRAEEMPEFRPSIEPLSKLLDDPDVAVRNQALEALKKIKATLAERDEWKRLVESLKPPNETNK